MRVTPPVTGHHGEWQAVLTSGPPQSVVAPEPGNTSARATVEALFRHRTAFWVTVGLILLLTAVITALTPRAYQSEMNILVRNARPDYLISPERSNGQILQRDVTEERINSEIEVLRSRDVADAVVDPGWAAVPAAQHSDSAVKAHEKAIVDFAKHLTVEALRKSNVIHVVYTTGDAHRATDTVERLLAAFLAKQREIERSTGASTFFAAEAARYKQQLDEAQSQLAGYQQQNQMVTLGTREATLESQIDTLDTAVRATQVQLTEAENRVASDKHQLAQLPERMGTQQRTVYNTQAVEQLTALLTNYQNERTTLLTRYQPSDRLVTEVNQKIQTTSTALAHAREDNGKEATTDVNPVYQQVKSVLAASLTDQAALRGRLADQTAQRDRLRSQLSGVMGGTVDYSTLHARVTELESNYQLYTQKKNEAQIADAMDQQQLVNVAVAERPTFPSKPYSPRVLLNLALGSFTALFLGCAVVFFAELGRDTIAAPYELESISNVPVLATIPHGPSGFTSPTSPGGGSRPAPVRTPVETTSVAPVSVPAASILDQPIVPMPDIVEASPEASDQAEMPTYDFTQPIVIRPLTPRKPASSYDQLAFAELAQKRQAAVPVAEPPVRDPQCRPSDPPRVLGAARPRVEPIPDADLQESIQSDPRHRTVQRAASQPTRSVPGRFVPRKSAYVTSTHDPRK